MVKGNVKITGHDRDVLRSSDRPIESSRRNLTEDQEFSNENPKDNNSLDNSQDIANPTSNATRLDRFKAIQRKQRTAEQHNRALLKESTTTRNAAKLAKQADRVEKLQQALDTRKESQTLGVAEERLKAWDYSIEETEAWNEKLAQKARLADDRFHDDDQSAARIYERNLKSLKNVESQSAAYGSHQPSEETLDRLSEHMTQQAVRKQAYSRKRIDTADVTYINKKNAHFNKKLARYFDKYTKETKDALERGTA